MNLNLENCTEQVRMLVKELSGQIDLISDANGPELIARKQDEPGFRLERTKEELKISYGSIPFFCRALLTAAGRKEDAYSYEETPGCKELGFMLDCSRNAVIRLPELKKYIRILALLGYTHIGLYMEDTVKVKGEPYVGYMRGAMTADELKAADAYAALFGMEVRPYIQTLAHLNQITRYHEYDEIIDCNDILLAGEERTYEFLEHLIGSVAGALRSRKLNIGMDEAHMIGLGKYLDRHGYCDRFDIMKKHLERVLAITKKYGYEVEMWSDMFFRLAFNGEYYVKDKDIEVNIPIPEDVKLVYWDYYATDTKFYDMMFANHKKLTENIGFAGGAWKWHGLSPHNKYSLITSNAAAASCIRNHIADITITGWGDDGAEASAFSVLPALYADAEYFYTKRSSEEAYDFEKDKFEVLTGIRFDAFMKLDDADILPEDGMYPGNSGKYFLYNDPLIGTFDSVVTEDTSAYYAETARELARYKDSRDFGYIFNAQAALCDVLALKASLGKRIRKAYSEGDREALSEIANNEIPEIIRRTDNLYEAMEVQWNTENKSFGFEVQCVRFGGLKQRLSYTGTILHRYLLGETDSIDELEEEYLPYAYTEPKSAEKLAYNLWRNIVSPSVTAW